MSKRTLVELILTLELIAQIQDESYHEQLIKRIVTMTSRFYLSLEF